MTQQNAPRLFVSDAQQKSFIEVVKFSIISKVTKNFTFTCIKVNENGTEAAAATFGKFSPTSLNIKTVEPKKIHADHPFLFAILLGKAENRHVLFMGQYNNNCNWLYFDRI